MADYFDQYQEVPPVGIKTPTPHPSDAYFDQFQNPSALKVSPDSETATMADRFRHWIGRFVPGAMSAGGSILGGAATEGLGGEALGAGAGSLLGQNLQEKFPRLFGAAPESSVGQTAMDVAGNALLPAAGGAVANALKSKGVNLLASPLLRRTAPVQRALGAEAEEGATKVLDKYVFPQSATIETAAQNAQDVYHADPMSNNFGGGTIGNKLLNIPYEQTTARAAKLSDINKTFMSDVTQVRNLKMATGEPYTAEQLGMSNLLQKGYSPTAGTINPDAILKEFDGKNADIYSEAIRPQTKANVVDVLNTIKDAQSKEAAGTPYNGMINYVKHRVMFDAVMMGGGALAGGLAGHEAMGLGAAGGIILSDMALNKLMSNPITAKAVVAAIKTPSTAAVSPMLSKIIQNGLRSTYVLINGPEDKLEKAYVDQNGQLTYQKPQGQGK